MPAGPPARPSPPAAPSRRDRLFTHLFLLRELIRRDFQGRYAGSWLGFLWSFVQPLWQLLLYSFVFSVVMRVSPEGEGTTRFWAFLFCGLLPWMALQEGLSRAATAITENANLVKKLRFSPEVLVLAVVLGALVHEAIAGGLFLVVLAGCGELSPGTLPGLLVALPLQLALTCGLGLLLAALQVFFRDTAQLLGMALGAWFYLTPIVYPLGLVPPALRPWLAANPLSALVAMYRASLLGGRPPSAASLGVLAACSGGLLLAGWALFRRLKPAFADEL